MVRKTRISVAMVSYNGGQYIGEQIASILPQLGEQDELVVSDDGSADQTLGIIQEYQRQDARVRLVEGPGKGVKKNVEHALRHTEGDYIFLADQDDIWMPDKVKQVMEAFRRQKAMVVIHDAAVFQEAPHREGLPGSRGRQSRARSRKRPPDHHGIFLPIPGLGAGRFQKYAEKQLYWMLYGFPAGTPPGSPPNPRKD